MVVIKVLSVFLAEETGSDITVHELERSADVEFLDAIRHTLIISIQFFYK